MKFMVDECVGPRVARWLEDERPHHKIEILEKVLKDFADKLKGNFVVVTEKGIRISSKGKGV